jgi:hypothetical protein
MNKKYDNNNIIIASRAYFLQDMPTGGARPLYKATCIAQEEQGKRGPR